MSTEATFAFEKFQGTGNDFVVVDADVPVPDRRAFARRICDRESGVANPAAERRGADGVLFLALHPEAAVPTLRMTLVQPDGSIAAMCGNGARCAARWAADRTGADEVLIQTDAGDRRAWIDPEGVTVEMGAPAFAPDDVPLAGDQRLLEDTIAGLELTAVNTGVPHAVAFVDDVDAVDLEAVGPEVRYHSRFPEGTNLTVAARRPDGGFDQRTYERGVEAETDACGTGAVAIAAVAERLGMVEPGRPVPVHPPGGRLTVTVDGDATTLSGPVVREYSGHLTPGGLPPEAE